MKRVYCPCGELAAIDDDFSNFQPIMAEDGKLKLGKMPLPRFCEDHELKLRWNAFVRLVAETTRP